MSNIDVYAKKFAGKSELFLRRHGPAILTAAGVGGIITTAVLTARATLKAQEPVKELGLKVDGYKELKDEKAKKQARVEIGRETIKIARIYLPVAASTSVTIFCFVASHRLMRAKQIALVAAYTALQASYDEYRERVREELGKEEELRLYNRPSGKPDLLGDPDEEAGIARYIDYDAVSPSPYAKFFGPLNPNWTKTPEFNLFYLKQQEMWANDRLNAYGFVFLNEVYEQLGMPRTQFGQIVGWKLDNGGDNFVSFNIYDIADESSIAFVNGEEGTILLDFNCDGPIGID